MPRIWQFVEIALAVAGLATAVVVVQACPYCPPAEVTLSEKLAESDAAYVVKFLKATDGEDLSQQTTTFEAVKSLTSRGTYKKGDVIVTAFGVTGEPGDHFLLMGQNQQETMEWSLPIRLDELGSEAEYVRNAPPPEHQPVQDRLRYFLKHLNSKNLVISNDAFAEFSKAKFEDVQQLAADVSPVEVREWIEDPSPQFVVRRAFYGMLLGLCGNDNDADYLERKILAPIEHDQNRLWIDGVMGGYLLLRGQPGLQLLMEKKFQSLPTELPVDDPAFVDLNALRVSLVFLWDYRRAQFPESVLRVAMRKFLERPELAEIAIVDLDRWKDWTSLDQLIAAFGRDPWETRSAKEKIVIFALKCQKDAMKSANPELRPLAAKAQAFLDGLDPALVESAKRSIGGIPANVPPTTTIKQLGGPPSAEE